MLLNVERLYAIANRSSRLIVGLMSGTSFDGLDIALCRVGGSGLQTKMELLHFETIGYRTEFKEELKGVFAKQQADLRDLTLLNESIGNYFGDLILQCLSKWRVDTASVDLVASHGQTVYHAPARQHLINGKPNGTLQIGDGDHIAKKTGIITLSDFRQKHLAAGGEGAPLAVYGDYFLFSSPDENRIMLNIGGIANFTWLPASLNAVQVYSTDTGPGNTLMDQYIQSQVPGIYYDKDASLAKTGKVDGPLLAELLNNTFFEAEFPKTTGPELFNLSYLEFAQERSGTQKLALPHVLATLCMFSASAIAEAIKKNLKSNIHAVVYVSGGGMHNPLLINNLAELLPEMRWKETGELGIDPDAKEAVLFAVLANETVAGVQTDFGNREGIPSVTMGKISFPE